MKKQKTVTWISPKELKRMMKDGKGFSLIDTLPGDHFEMIHLPGANNACVFEVAFCDKII